MNCQDLINRLVARKMKSPGNGKVFCVCFAGTSAAARQQPADAKK